MRPPCAPPIGKAAGAPLVCPILGDMTDFCSAVDDVWSEIQLGEERITKKQLGFVIGLLERHHAPLILNRYPKPDRAQVSQLSKGVASMLITALQMDPATDRNREAAVSRRLDELEEGQAALWRQHESDRELLERRLEAAVRERNDLEKNLTPERESFLDTAIAEIRNRLGRPPRVGQGAGGD